MSRLTKPGLSHSPSIGGTGICIDQIDQGAILIGTGVDFDLNTLTAGPGVAIVNGPGTITISATGTFELPIASPTSLGGIKVGANLSIDGAGVLSAGNSYVLPIASASVLGGIKVGANLSIDVGGVLSGTAPYVLPIASATTLGGIKIGSNLSVDVNGVLSGSAPYVLPIASATVLGGIKVGANLSISGSGVLSASSSYVLPIASASVLGGIKVGSGLSIDGSGILSSSGGGTVTSVAITVPSELSVSGSPITTSGTFALSWSSETQNYVFAAPSSGSGTPSFRLLVPGDIPSLDVSKITTGTFATSFIPNLDASKITTGLLSASIGGTGVNSSGASNGQLLIGTGTGFALSTITAGASMSITNASGGITIDFVGGAGSGGALSPLTTKGDLWTYSTVDTRLGVSGTNGNVLTEDSTQASGLKWVQSIICRANGSITINNGSWTAIPMNNTALDQGTSTAQHSNTTDNTRFTCRVAGTYFVHGKLDWPSNGAGGRVAAFWVNGVDTVEAGNAPNPTGFGSIQHISNMLTLAVNDYVELYGLQSSGSNLSSINGVLEWFKIV